MAGAAGGMDRGLLQGLADTATVTRPYSASAPIAMEPVSTPRAAASPDGDPDSGYSGYSAAGMVIVQRAHVDKTVERERLEKQISECEMQLRTTEAKLANKSFIERAPATVVEEHRRRLKDFSEQLAKLKHARECLN